MTAHVSCKREKKLWSLVQHCCIDNPDPKYCHLDTPNFLLEKETLILDFIKCRCGHMVDHDYFVLISGQRGNQIHMSNTQRGGHKIKQKDCSIFLVSPKKIVGIIKIANYQQRWITVKWLNRSARNYVKCEIESFS